MRISGYSRATTSATTSSAVVRPEREGPAMIAWSPSYSSKPAGSSVSSPIPNGTNSGSRAARPAPSSASTPMLSGSTSTGGGPPSTAGTARALAATSADSGPGARATWITWAEPPTTARPALNCGMARRASPNWA